MRFSVPAVAAAALSAAVLAHAGIDIAGDYLLRDDTYDHVSHGSRELVSLIALLCACGAAALFIAQLFAAVGSVAGRARLLRMPRSRIALFALAVPAFALAVVPLMETIDTLRAGADIDSLADAFGGSLLLGCSMTIGCAAAICAILFGAVAWLCRHRERVARIVATLLERRRHTGATTFAARSSAGPIPRARELRAQRRGKRGPPLRARIIPVFS